MSDMSSEKGDLKGGSDSLGFTTLVRASTTPSRNHPAEMEISNSQHQVCQLLSNFALTNCRF